MKTYEQIHAGLLARSKIPAMVRENGRFVRKADQV